MQYSLYYWPSVSVRPLSNYGNGQIFCIAPDIETSRKNVMLCIDKEVRGNYAGDLDEYQIVEIDKFKEWLLANDPMVFPIGINTLTFLINGSD